MCDMCKEFKYRHFDYIYCPYCASKLPYRTNYATHIRVASYSIKDDNSKENK